MKKILVTGLLVSSMFYNVGCTSDEVAASAIGVGLVIGIAGGFGDSHSDNRHDDRRDHSDHGGYDGRGNNRCNQSRCYNSAESESSAAAGQQLVREMEVSSFSQKHNIKEAAGQKIQQAFANVSKSGISAFEAIGLNQSALNKIMSRELPEDASIQTMGTKLDISAAQSRDLLQDLVAEFNTAASDSQSEYWKSCEAKGQWKTPQNAFCTDASWNGCSPETGAALCY